MTAEPFAHEIPPGRPFIFTGYSWLVLKMVSLCEASGSSKTVVSVQRKGEDYVLCTLVPKKREQVQINLQLSTDDIPLTRFTFSGNNNVLLTGYTGKAGSKREIKRKRAVQFTKVLETYESDESDDADDDEEDAVDDERETDEDDEDEDNDKDTEGDADTDTDTDTDTDKEDHDDDDDDDEDFVPDSDEEFMQSVSNRFHFCDTTDRRFMSGLELRHFGLQPSFGCEEDDDINLREDEEDMIEKETNDNIALALINGLANSGEAPNITKAPKLLEKLKQTAPGIDRKIVRFEDTDKDMFKKKRKLMDDTVSESNDKQKKVIGKRRRIINNTWIVS